MNDLSAGFGQISGSQGIHLVSRFLVGFGFIHRRVSGAIDDVFDGIFGYEMLHLRQIGDIQHVVIGKNKPKRSIHFSGQLLQFLSQLSVRAGYQHVFLNQSIKKCLFSSDGFRSAKMLV